MCSSDLTQVEDMQRRISEQDQQLRSQNQALAERELLIQTQQQQASALERSRAQVQAELATLSQAHQALLQSHSWRVTRPLRWLGRWLRGSD